MSTREQITRRVRAQAAWRKTKEWKILRRLIKAFYEKMPLEMPAFQYISEKDWLDEHTHHFYRKLFIADGQIVRISIDLKPGHIDT